MSSIGKIDIKRWAGFVIAILMARPTGDHLTAFIDFVPAGMDMDFSTWSTLNSISNFFEAILGYGLTGALLGVCAYFLLGDEGKKSARWIPLLLVAAIFFSAFINLFSAGRAADFSVFGILGLLLTRVTGYAYLFLLPATCYLVMWYLESRKKELKTTLSEFAVWLKFIFSKE